MRRCFVFVLGSSNRVCKEKRERENFDKEDISCDRFRNEIRRNECVWLHHLHEKKRERDVLEIEFKFNNSKKRKSIEMAWHGSSSNSKYSTETISEDSRMDVGNSQQQ